MDNPGLKRHISDAPLLKVTHRRTANPIMPEPRTLGQDGYQDGVNDLYVTQREDVETPPPLTGLTPSNMVPATNGEEAPYRGADLGGYRAAYDDDRGDWVYDIDSPHYPGVNPPPSQFSDSAQQMLTLKRLWDGSEGEHEEVFDSPHHHPSYPACETCAFSHPTGEPSPPNEGRHHPDYGDHEYNPPGDLPSGVRLAGAGETMIPGAARQKMVPDRPQEMVDEQNAMSRQRRIDTQQQVGGGEKENPAYDQAQQRIREKMQVRRAHPLHQATQNEEVDSYGPTEITPEERDEMKAVAASSQAPAGQRFSAFDEERNQWLYDLDDPDYYWKDSAPSSDESTHQPMYRMYWDHPNYQPYQFDEEGHLLPGEMEYGKATHTEHVATTAIPAGGSTNSFGPVCETCWLRDGIKNVFPEGHEADPEHYGHEFKPMVMEQNQRYSNAQWDMLDERPESFDLPEHYRQQGLHVNVPDNESNLAFFYDPSVRDREGLVRSNPSSRMMFSVQPDHYVHHDSDDTADPQHVVDDERYRGDRFDPESEPCADCWVKDEAVIGKNEHRKRDEDHPWRGAEQTELSRFGHHDPDQDIKDVLAVQGSPGNWDADPYMHGMFNGMELVRSIHDGDEPKFREAPDEWLIKDAAAGDDLAVRQYEGEEGNSDHITRSERGRIPLDWVKNMPGARGERPGEHRNYQGAKWESFKDHVWDGTPGYSDPIFITVDHGGQPVINEGNHRRDAHVDLGLTHIPAEIRYFGHAERQGTVGERAALRHQAAIIERGVDDDGLLYFRDSDFRPPGTGGRVFTDQPMFTLKRAEPREDSNILDDPSHYRPQGGCETCWLRHKNDQDSPNTEEWHRREYPDHPFKPFSDEQSKRFSAVARQENPGLVLFAAQVPNHEDPVYPYSGVVDPEDTVDPENLQSGDDTFRPHHPLVDRAINHMQGLPDMSRGHPLMDRVNEILDEGPDTEEHNRGADALAGGLNTIFDSMRDTEGMSKEDQLQAAKDAIDAHIETGRMSYQDHVKRLQDDWNARGGRKTKEPKPVDRFRANQGLQQIVPDPNNIYPENTSPIYPVGKCEGCGKKLFDSEGNSGDPRGELGDNTVGHIHAADYDATDVPKEERTGDRRMHGPSALICPNCENESDRYNSIIDKYRGHKAGDKTGDGYWGVPFGSPAGTKRQFIPTTYAKDRKGKWHNPGEKPGSCPECDAGITGWHRQAAVEKQSETDEEFWARMEREHPGEQPQTQPYTYLSPDAVSQAGDEDQFADEDWDTADVPYNMSMRDHAKLVNSGTFSWDGDQRYPKYEYIVPRTITTADGEPAYANEGHVIEHNTNHHGPVLSTEDNPDPHPLEYQWTHTYYPAGHTDDQGFVKGYNSLDRAMGAANKLSLYGPHHPRSAEALGGYERVGDNAPYEPAMIDSNYGKGPRPNYPPPTRFLGERPTRTMGVQ